MKKISGIALGIWIPFLISSCSMLSDLGNSIGGVDPAPTPVVAAKLYPAKEVSDGWIPNVDGAGDSDLKGTVTITTRTITKNNVGMVRFQDTWGDKEFEVNLGTFDAETDFGYDASGNGNGSLTLTADAIRYPFSGGAYPVLTSLSVMDGATQIAEFVNLNSNCSTQGMWVCSGGYCSPNKNCTVVNTPESPSSFFSREDWDQHQTPPYGYTSVNLFPRCDPDVNGWTSCSDSLKTLPSGTYVARYVLMSDRGTSVATVSTDFQVKMTIKKDTQSRNVMPNNGSIDLNVVLVGDENVNDSHTAKGALNLNLLFEEVNRILSAGANKISLGRINVFEWRDSDGGDYYSQIDYTKIGELFAKGSSGIPAEEDGKAINIFMVRDIGIQNVSYSILGIAGAVMGPPVNGRDSSGLAFSMNVTNGAKGVLSEFNTSTLYPCTVLSCPRDNQDASFLEMGATIAHELGHYLGLNHPSEKVTSLSETQKHDQLIDTPTCAPRSSNGSVYLDQRSCYLDSTVQAGGKDCKTNCDVSGQYYIGTQKNNSYYCPAASACQFNHSMWYTTKYRTRFSGAWREDGSQISPQSSAILQWNPFVR